MKRFFLDRSRREQVLILLFVLIGLAWWGSSLMGRANDQYREWRAAHEEFKTQELWIEQQEEIFERVAMAGETLDPSRALDSAQTFAELNKMLANLNAEVSSQRTERTRQFALHGMQVNIRRAPLADVLKFYQQLSARAPYLGIDSCVISADRSSRGLINVNFRIYSIEVITAEE